MKISPVYGKISSSTVFKNVSKALNETLAERSVRLRSGQYWSVRTTVVCVLVSQ